MDTRSSRDNGSFTGGGGGRVSPSHRGAGGGGGGSPYRTNSFAMERHTSTSSAAYNPHTRGGQRQRSMSQRTGSVDRGYGSDRASSNHSGFRSATDSPRGGGGRRGRTSSVYSGGSYNSSSQGGPALGVSGGGRDSPQSGTARGGTSRASSDRLSRYTLGSGGSGAAASGGLTEAQLRERERERRRDPRFTVHEEGTDMERFAEVALLLLKGHSAPSDEVLKQISEPDYVMSVRRRQARLGTDDLPTSAFKGVVPSSHNPSSSSNANAGDKTQSTFNPSRSVENSFDLWFLQLASMEDHVDVAASVVAAVGGGGDGGDGGAGGRTGGRTSSPSGRSGSPSNGKSSPPTKAAAKASSAAAMKASKAMAAHRSRPCVAESIYRIQRLLKYQNYRNWRRQQYNQQREQQQAASAKVQEASLRSASSFLLASSIAGTNVATSYVDDDECIMDLGWHLESFKERGVMKGSLAANGNGGGVGVGSDDEDEDPIAREHRIRSRRAVAHKASQEDRREERDPSLMGSIAAEAAAAAAAKAGGNSSINGSTRNNTASSSANGSGNSMQRRLNAVVRHGPADAGVYAVLPDVGLGCVLGGTFVSDLEEPETDYKDLLFGEPDGLRRRLRKHIAANSYGDSLLQHFTTTIGAEPPRERFGMRCRRYLLARRASLIPQATRMLSEVFHNYLKALAITFRMLLTGADATIDHIGISDVAKYSVHPPPFTVLEKAVAEEEAEATARLVRTATLAEVSSANSFVSVNKTQQAMKARLAAQRKAAAMGIGVADDLPGMDDDDVLALLGGASAGGGGFVVSANTPKTALERDVLESDEHIADPFSRIWCIAKLLMNIYSPMLEGTTGCSSRAQQACRKHYAANLERGEHLTVFYRIAELLKTNLNGSPMDESVEEQPLSDKQLVFANLLNVAALLAPAIEIASERLLMLELVRRFGPEPIPPLPTVHTSEPLTTINRLQQFCRMDRFYRFHERELDEAERLTYQHSVTNSYDTEYIGARHTRKSLWQIFCRYYYYADDRQTTDPASSAEVDDAFEKSWRPPEVPVPFGSAEYFEKRFEEMSRREKAFYNEDNFKRLVARHRRMMAMGVKGGDGGDGGANADFSTLTTTAEQVREERLRVIGTIPADHVNSPYFGELKSLKTLWQQLLYKYGEEPFSESEVEDQKRKAAERAERLKPERKKLQIFYQYYAPDKTAADIDGALDRFDDNIPKMWELLEQKYGPLHVAIARDAGGVGGISSADGGDALEASGGGGRSSLTGGVGIGSLLSDGAADSQLSQLAILKEVLLVNGDPFKQLWYVDSLVKTITKHIERERAAGVPHEPIVNPYAPIQVTQSMLDVYLGVEAHTIKQRHLLSVYFQDKGYAVTAADINQLIEHYRYSPMGFEHMWAELTAYYGPDRDPIDTENEASRAEMEFIEKRRHTNDADVIGKGLVARKSKVVGTDDQAHWMLEREDIVHADRLENYFDYYTSGGDHFLDLVTQEELLQQKMVANATATGRRNSATTAVVGGSGLNTSAISDATNKSGQAAAAAASSSVAMTNLTSHFKEDPNPNKYHRRHAPRSREDLLALQRRFLQGSAGGYAFMWRSLEEKYGPQPPDTYTRYNNEIKRLKREAAKRQKAAAEKGAREAKAAAMANSRLNGNANGTATMGRNRSASLRSMGSLDAAGSFIVDSVVNGSFAGSGAGGVAEDLDLSPLGSPRGGGGGGGGGHSPSDRQTSNSVATTAFTSSPASKPLGSLAAGGGADNASSANAAGGGNIYGANTDPLASSHQSQSTAANVVLGSEQRKGALLAKATHSDPEKVLRDLQSSSIATAEEEQALIDMFLRWKGPRKAEVRDIGKGLAVGQPVPALVFEADLRTIGRNLGALEGGNPNATHVPAIGVGMGGAGQHHHHHLSSVATAPPQITMSGGGGGVAVTPMRQQMIQHVVATPTAAIAAAAVGTDHYSNFTPLVSSDTPSFHHRRHAAAALPTPSSQQYGGGFSTPTHTNVAANMSSATALSPMVDGGSAIRSSNYDFYSSFYAKGGSAKARGGGAAAAGGGGGHSHSATMGAANGLSPQSFSVLNTTNNNSMNDGNLSSGLIASPLHAPSYRSPPPPHNNHQQQQQQQKYSSPASTSFAAPTTSRSLYGGIKGTHH